MAAVPVQLPNIESDVPLISAPQEVAHLNVWLRVGIGIVTTSVLAFALLCYTFPNHYDSWYWGLDAPGVRYYQNALHLGWIPQISAAAFNGGFKALTLLQWGGYALMLAAGYKGARLSLRSVLVLTAALGVFLGVACPPLLTTDVYGYTVFGRMAACYGLNPYITLPEVLAKRHDPAVRFMAWNMSTVYGPVWTLLNIGLVASVKSAGVVAQGIALKSAEAGALLLAAWAGGRLAERIEPGRGPLTALAIGLNPLFLLEGPGNGHNDLLLVALLLTAALFFSERKYGLAGLLLGLSIGVKVITIAALPWLCLLLLSRRHREGSLALGLARAGKLAFLSVLPTVLGYLPFWVGAKTLASAEARSQWQVPADALKREILVWQFLTDHHIGGTALKIGMALAQHTDIIAVFLIATLWVLRSADKERWLAVWAILSAAVMVRAMGLAFPWYVLWFWPVCLVRWNRLHLGLSALCFAAGLLDFSLYCCLTRFG